MHGQGRLFGNRPFNTGYQDGNYGLPSGHLDGGERVTAAMAREAQEEIGIIIKPSDLCVVHVLHRTMDLGERINFFLTTDTWQGQPAIMEPHKCDGLAWFSLDNLPHNTIVYVHHALDCYQKGITFSEFGWA